MTIKKYNKFSLVLVLKMSTKETSHTCQPDDVTTTSHALSDWSIIGLNFKMAIRSLFNHRLTLRGVLIKKIYCSDFIGNYV